MGGKNGENYRAENSGEGGESRALMEGRSSGGKGVKRKNVFGEGKKITPLEA